ncbi:ABC transporter substrate-binding protein [Labrys wisconsinensis]|uniref:ABC-type glycerol-3-phosphate transport system substrate-binding protein n=1 Tax=Labrys wisconsinensis TaxID=425677 RepID=A0ABU0JDT6_9HYPH|nr:ABC transporter substrate-binding protein [Labrys wisconsinensis]MDQ0471780.1 ABC-type glycerol-3-phosphate transport system substrate-binding protein [Labrys wisconsinensis]
MRNLKWAVALAAVLASSTAALAQSKPEIWNYYAAGSEKAGMDALIAYANKQNPDTPVGSRIIPGNVVELRRQLQTAFMGGKPPAAYQSSMASELKTFVDGGRLHPLTDVWKEIDGDKIFPEGVQRAVKINGIPYGIPFDFSLINEVFYNKSIFEKLKLSAPKNWDEFVAACDTLRKGGVEPLANAGGPFWSLYNFYAPLVSTVGVDGYYRIARGELAFDSPEFRKALDLYRKSMVSCYARNWSGKTWTQAADDLANAKAGMFMMGIWAAAYLQQAGMEAGKAFDVFPAPGTEDKVIFQMDAFAVPEGPQDNIKTAEAFIKATSSVDGQAAFAVPKGSLAPNIQVSPKIYGYAGARFAEQLALASKSQAVLPNLFFLLPPDVGAELGNQIERFAIDPSQANEDAMISTLEGARKDALESNAYIKW